MRRALACLAAAILLAASVATASTRPGPGAHGSGDDAFPCRELDSDLLPLACEFSFAAGDLGPGTPASDVRVAFSPEVVAFVRAMTDPGQPMPDVDHAFLYVVEASDGQEPDVQPIDLSGALWDCIKKCLRLAGFGTGFWIVACIVAAGAAAFASPAASAAVVAFCLGKSIGVATGIIVTLAACIAECFVSCG